ncbi:MAG: phosphoribulokinase [Anaerolineae bacterium]|nr:phosphoribulokinase [Anaerolineae bacterium]MCB0179066.1 phosphoribulokinase [Anaerolineae bacterium]MCB0226900.1 phosphoribulokinase [Anaerolineae bacterium]MCB9107399.1 phosphoribulokinase [Anaerolineales bacterium]
MQRQRPIILGIVGDSAVGKTTISQGLVKILGQDRVTHFCTDDYHKYDRRERAELGISALHPDCNYLDILELHLERLHYGQPILKPIYDHSTGSLVRPEYIHPREFVIVEGLLGYATPAMQQFYDVKVYLEPLEELRHIWKIKRDTTKRGYTREQVIASLKKRECDSANFIQPQRKAADIVVRFSPPAGVKPEDAGSHLDVRLTLRPTIPHPDLSYLFERNGSAVRMEMKRADNRPADVLEIDGNATADQTTELEDAIWQHLPDLRPLREEEFGDYQDQTEMRHSSPLALSQLLLAYHLLRQYNNVARMPFAPPVAALSRLGSVPASRPLA